MTNAYLKLFLVGTGWMNQTISLIQVLNLSRPFESSTEARDAVQTFRRELLESAKISHVDGLTNVARSFGDFQTITDVRMEYVVQTQGTAQGVFGETTTVTTAQSDAVEFLNPDSEFALNYDEEEEV